jgi:hypothetical protein
MNRLLYSLTFIFSEYGTLIPLILWGCLPHINPVTISTFKKCDLFQAKPHINTIIILVQHVAYDYHVKSQLTSTQIGCFLRILNKYASLLGSVCIYISLHSTEPG